MTEDNENADEIRSAEHPSGPETSGRTELPSDWQELPIDPDPNGNLGYELIKWEKINVADNPDQVIFLPDSEEQLKDDAFIVSNKNAVCDLSDRR